MEINSTLQAKLDAPTKAFEVAFRCYVADNLLSNYSDETSLQTEIQSRITSAKDAKVILSGKISSATTLLSSKEWKSFWENTVFSRDCYLRKEQFLSHDVVYLSQTLLMTYIFQDIHKDFIASFEKPENYLYFAQKYYDVRNSLSHQGSYIITDTDAEDCLYFIKKGCEFIEKRYFWFRSVSEIKNDMDIFEKILHMKEPMIDNLDIVPFPSNNIVCREPELMGLFKYVCGWDGDRKLRNRKHLVCISGYGGIGKTSLAIEFISRLLEQMTSEKYEGLRPAFILFYSAKQQTMEFDKNSGSLYTRNIRSQFSNHDELISHLYHDLSIDRFDDSWEKTGILIIDNLETLAIDERQKILDYINYEIPSSVQVIITTRIPEHADEQMQLRGFQNEAGSQFINEYLIKNNIEIDLTEEQKKELVKYSYGNSLVLVLALKRLATRITSYRAILQELQLLPKKNTDNSISHFMFQNTITEILQLYSEKSEIIKNVLICLSLRSEALTPDLITAAHRDSNITIEDIEAVLQLLSHYLIVEKLGDTYIINEFANHFILTSMSPSQETRRMWASNLLSAMHEIERHKMTVIEFKIKYPQLSDILVEWSGECEGESLAICHAFCLYDYKKTISRSNAAFEIDNLKREFDRVMYQYSNHPYVFYQYARILKELRYEKTINDEYNELIKSNYEKCLMMIDTPSFSQIKATQTYPSILWIYSMFLFSASYFEEASRYADDAVQNYKFLGIDSADTKDALAIYGMAEIKLFEKDMLSKQHLKNARTALEQLKKTKSMPMNLKQHYEQLSTEINKYTRIKI